MFLNYEDILELQIPANELMQREITVISTKGIEKEIGSNKTAIFPRLGENAIIVAVDKYPEGHLKILYSEEKSCYIPNSNLQFLPISKTEIDFLIKKLETSLKRTRDVAEFIQALPEGTRFTKDALVFNSLSDAFRLDRVKTPEDLASLLSDLNIQ